jgi:hypothetical protein
VPAHVCAEWIIGSSTVAAHAYSVVACLVDIAACCLLCRVLLLLRRVLLTAYAAHLQPEWFTEAAFLWAVELWYAYAIQVRCCCCNML